jgi:hypothetical protein
MTFGVFVPGLLALAIKILRVHQRAVVFGPCRLNGVKVPDVPRQQVIGRDKLRGLCPLGTIPAEKGSNDILSVPDGTGGADHGPDGGCETGLKRRPGLAAQPDMADGRKERSMPDIPAQPARRAIVRALRPWLWAALLALTALPAAAQDGTGPAPENAHDRRFGNGWDCDPGYRVAEGVCVALDMPANAFATGRTHGTGWACQHGYRELRGGTCEAIHIPANAFLDASGLGWECSRGYRKRGDECTSIEVPSNAYLSDRGVGPGWECNRGHVARAGTCEPIVIPQNAYATNASHGSAWRCERGFVQIGSRCDPVPVPENAFLDYRAHGPGWQCERGFQTRQDSCARIVLPLNAHLDRSGNRWQCNRGFQLSEGGLCSLIR